MNAMIRNLLPLQKTAPEAQSRPRLEDHAPYAEAQQRHVDLLGQLATLEAESATIRTRALAGSAFEPKPGQERVAELAGLAKPNIQASDRKRLSDIHADIDALREAIEITRQRERAEWLIASAMVCDALQPEHSTLMRDLFAKLAEVHAIWSKHEAMLDKLTADNIAFGRLHPQRPDFLGVAPHRRDGELASWMRDMEKAGFVQHNELPEAYR